MVSWLEKGLAHYAHCNWDQAGEALEHSVIEQPDNADAWYKLGNVRTEQRRDPDALECFSRALALDPSHAKARNNFGAADQRLGRCEEAFTAYKQALESDPTLLEPYLNLGRLSETQGALHEAAAYLKAGLERHPGHPMLVHLLAAASGQHSPRAPRDHIVAYFDDFAARFDAHLVGNLGYQVPVALAEILRAHLAPGARVLDLGCGTGLMAAALAGSELQLTGVDLSSGMLNRARERGIYAELVLGDVEDVLDRLPAASYRAVIATDVFIYIGELHDVFRAVARALEPHGLFGFSVEALQGASYALRSSGRYAHPVEYLRRLCAEAGFREIAVEPTVLRRDKGEPVEGLLVLLERL